MDPNTTAPIMQEQTLLHHIWHALGRLEEGQKLNRQSAEERVAALRDHVDTRIEDLKENLHHRIGRLEKRKKDPWWKDIPWHHVITLGASGYLLVQGHMSAGEIKSVLLKLAGG